MRRARRHGSRYVCPIIWLLKAVRNRWRLHKLMLSAYLLFSFIDAGAKWLALLGLPSTRQPLCAMRLISGFKLSLCAPMTLRLPRPMHLC